MTALTLATEGQVEQITRVVMDATKKALKPLDKDAAQRVHSRGDELTTIIAKAIADLSVSDRYAGEVVASSYTYPKSYRPKPIGEQIEMLAKAFSLDPTSAYEHVKNLPELPEGAEGWFAIVRSEALSASYGEAVEKVLAVISERRRFHNWREGQLSDVHIRVSARTKEALAKLTAGQEGDILVIPAQLGLRHRGKSVRRARETFRASEFGLSSVCVGSIAITHPERFQQFDELDIDCSGDEYSPDADCVFDDAPIFRFRDGGLEFDDKPLDLANEYFGSASGFLPE